MFLIFRCACKANFRFPLCYFFPEMKDFEPKLRLTGSFSIGFRGLKARVRLTVKQVKISMILVKIATRNFGSRLFDILAHSRRVLRTILAHSRRVFRTKDTELKIWQNFAFLLGEGGRLWHERNRINEKYQTPMISVEIESRHPGARLFTFWLECGECFAPFSAPNLSCGPRNLGGKIGSCMLMKGEILKM